jgi:SAM-dependent methyltransferase
VNAPAPAAHRAFYGLYHDDSPLRALDPVSTVSADSLIEQLSTLPLPPRPRILDLGCGDGRHSLTLCKRLRAVVTGVDPDPAALRAARAAVRHPRIRFRRGSTTALPFARPRFHLVWCHDALVHAPRPAAAARDVARVLIPGGWLFLVTAFTTGPLAPGDWRRLRPARLSRAAMHRPTLLAAFRRAGFRLTAHLPLGASLLDDVESSEHTVSRDLYRLLCLERGAARWRRHFGAPLFHAARALLAYNALVLQGAITYDALLWKRP